MTMGKLARALRSGMTTVTGNPVVGCVQVHSVSRIQHVGMATVHGFGQRWNPLHPASGQGLGKMTGRAENGFLIDRCVGVETFGVETARGKGRLINRPHQVVLMATG